MKIPYSIGPYRVIKRLASGGMAELYLAQLSDQVVVIKQIHQSLLLEPDSRKLFIHEAQLYQRMSHPNIVALIDFSFDADSFWMVLQHIDGCDLQTFISHIQKLSEASRVKVGLQIASDLLNGLAYAHGLRDEEGFPLYLVHRDVSPSNILIARNGKAKLCDFGLAKSRLGSALTGKGFTRGKLRYMAPEQLEGHVIDHRTDLFAAALCLHEILSGSPLLNGSNDDQNAHALRSGSYLRTLSRRWSHRPAIHALLYRALQPKPADRFQSAAEFLMALSKLKAPPAPRSRPKRWSRAISFPFVLLLAPIAILVRSATKNLGVLRVTTHFRPSNIQR